MTIKWYLDIKEKVHEYRRYIDIVVEKAGKYRRYIDIGDLGKYRKVYRDKYVQANIQA